MKSFSEKQKGKRGPETNLRHVHCRHCRIQRHSRLTAIPGTPLEYRRYALWLKHKRVTRRWHFRATQRVLECRKHRWVHCAGATQLPFDWHGTGYGSESGPGSKAALETWVGRVCEADELKEAEARPAKATSSAKTRTATFIFSNLSMFSIEGYRSLIGFRCYRNSRIKSRFFL